jgi:uncharacterized protein (TIGR02145 family)
MRTFLWAFFFLFIGCKEPAQNNPTPVIPELPTLEIVPITDVLYNTAKVYAKITSEGKSAVTGAGIAWGTNPNPTVFDNFIPVTGFGTGTFNVFLTKLQSGTTYYVRAYATNSGGTSYSTEQNFSTKTPNGPTLSPVLQSDVGSYKIKVKATVSDSGSSHVNNRGFCYDTLENPEFYKNKTIYLGQGTGQMATDIIGLRPGKTYYLRAFARNSFSVSYSQPISFTTNSSPFLPGSGVIDIEGNAYQTIIIGNQEWMKENLKVEKYRNGDPIKSWTADQDGIFRNAANLPANKEIYGYLYNFFAVIDSRGLCPAGWHVPTSSEWYSLIDLIGGSQNAGSKLKAVSSLWYFPNSGATNETGMSALPAGSATNYLGKNCFFWTSTNQNALGINIDLRYESTSSFSTPQYPTNTFSVRCIKD